MESLSGTHLEKVCEILQNLILHLEEKNNMLKGMIPVIVLWIVQFKFLAG